MTDPITMQRQLADRLNATLETSNEQNLAQDASLDNVDLVKPAPASASDVSAKEIIAFDELQKKLYAEKAPENDAPKEKTHQPILIAVFMFTLAAIVIGGEYLL